MTPDNLQTVFTVLDVLALIPWLFLVGLSFLGIFTGGAKASGDRVWCLIYFLAAAWLIVRYLSVGLDMGWIV